MTCTCSTGNCESCLAQAEYNEQQQRLEAEANAEMEARAMDEAQWQEDCAAADEAAYYDSQGPEY